MKVIEKIKFNQQGNLLAAVTDQGKRIVIVSLKDAKVKVVCKRGITSSIIYNIDFAYDNKFICITNNK